MVGQRFSAGRHRNGMRRLDSRHAIRPKSRRNASKTRPMIMTADAPNRSRRSEIVVRQPLKRGRMAIPSRCAGARPKGSATSGGQAIGAWLFPRQAFAVKRCRATGVSASSLMLGGRGRRPSQATRLLAPLIRANPGRSGAASRALTLAPRQTWPNLIHRTISKD